MGNITVHVADNHQIIIDGIKQLLKLSSIDVVGVSNNGLEVIEWCKNNTCDVIVLDISMSELNGIEVLKYFKENAMKQNVVVFSSYLKFQFIEDTVKNGAKSYLLKDDDPENLITAIKNAKNGNNFFSKKVKRYLIDEHISSKGENSINVITDLLSEKEFKIIKMLVNQHDTAEIGEKMNIKPSTVRTMTSRLRDKFEVSTNVGLALRFSFLSKK